MNVLYNSAVLGILFDMIPFSLDTERQKIFQCNVQDEMTFFIHSILFVYGIGLTSELFPDCLKVMLFTLDLGYRSGDRIYEKRCL